MLNGSPLLAVSIGLAIDRVLWVWYEWWMVVRAVSFPKALQVLVWNPEFPLNTTILNIIDLWNFVRRWMEFLHIVYLCGNKYRSTEWGKQRLFIWSITRKSAMITCVWLRLKGRQRTEKALRFLKTLRKGPASCVPWLEVVGEAVDRITRSRASSVIG